MSYKKGENVIFGEKNSGECFVMDNTENVLLKRKKNIIVT